MMGGSSVAQGRGGPQSQVPLQPNLRNQVPPPILPSQVAHVDTTKHLRWPGRSHVRLVFFFQAPEFLLPSRRAVGLPWPGLGLDGFSPSVTLLICSVVVRPQVPPSLLKYPGGNGGLNTLLDPRQVAVLKQLSQFSQLSQLNQLNQLQVKVVADARLRRCCFLLEF